MPACMHACVRACVCVCVCMWFMCGYFRMWEVDTCQELKQLTFGSAPASLSLSPDMNTVIVTHGQNIAFYNAETCAILLSLQSGCLAVSFKGAGAGGGWGGGGMRFFVTVTLLIKAVLECDKL